MSLPTDRQERKDLPIFSGVLAYFPDALAEVARVSKVGNDQHNPGEPLHWAKEKSTDEPDALVRHLLEHGSLDTDGTRHSAKVAWRALALLQREIDAERAASSLTEEPGPIVTENGYVTPDTPAGRAWANRREQEDAAREAIRRYNELGGNGTLAQHPIRFGGVDIPVILDADVPVDTVILLDLSHVYRGPSDDGLY